MRKVIYTIMASLDGFINRPDGSLDWVIIDDELHQFANDQQREIGGHLYGRRMYETMVAYWPTADANPAALDVEVEYARIWRNMPKVVFSRTLEKVEWNSRLVRDGIPEEVARLKAQPGMDLELGGANLAATFIKLGLIDEYRLFIQPVVLGGGAPLFPALNKSLGLRLVETRAFTSGVVYLRYDAETASPPAEGEERRNGI